MQGGKRRKIIVGVCIMLTSIIFVMQYVSALAPLSIIIDKTSYGLEDTLNISAVVRNINPSRQEAKIETLLRNKEGTSPLAVIPSAFFLEANELKIIPLYLQPIKDTLPFGNYTMTARLFSSSTLISMQEISFFVEGLKPLQGAVSLCKDERCTQESRVFAKGEQIFISFSSPQNASVSAKLIAPAQTTKEIALPVVLTADSVGSYTLEIAAQKEGYQTLLQKEQFSVIEQPIEIKSIEVEDIKTPPTLRGKSERFLPPYAAIAVIAVIVIGIIILIFVIILIMRARKNRAQSEIFEVRKPI